MIRLFVLIFLLVPQISWGQSSLPPCTAAESDLNAFRHNCFGTVTIANGDKYVGEWRDGKRNGQGATSTSVSSETASSTVRGRSSSLTVTSTSGNTGTASATDRGRTPSLAVTSTSGNTETASSTDRGRSSSLTVTDMPASSGTASSTDRVLSTVQTAP